MVIEVYASSSTAGTSGFSGWGVVIQYPTGHQKTLSCASGKLTSNQMEMRAITEALKTLPEGSQVRVSSCSEYLVNGMTKWLAAWIANGWKTRKGRNVKNQQDWEALQEAAASHKISWSWVTGQNASPEIAIADGLVATAISHVATDNSLEGEIMEGERHAPGVVKVLAENDFRVIRTDNYNTGKAPVEYFVAQRLSQRKAELVANTLNNDQSADAEDFFRVVPYDYILSSPS